MQDAIRGFSLSGTAGRLEITLRLDNLVDTGPWLSRQKKRLENVGSFEQRLEERLADPRFREKAPPDVIDQHEKRLEETRDIRRKVESLISKLSY